MLAWAGIGLAVVTGRGLVAQGPPQVVTLPPPINQTEDPILKPFVWRPIGPANVGGRIDEIAIVESDPNIAYVAAPGHLFGPNRERGLYKTTDGGQTWTNTKFIDENTGFTDVVIDPSNPNVLIAASYQRRRTPWGFNGGGAGSGIWKTTDGARTWMKL